MKEALQNNDVFAPVKPRLEQLFNFGMLGGNSKDNSVYYSEGVWHILQTEIEQRRTGLNTILKLIASDDNGETVRIIQSGFERRENFKAEFPANTGKGRIRFLQLEVFFSGDDTFAGLLRDITETHEIKLALEEKIYQFDKSNRSLQEFVYVASHDLQEPVRKISTFAHRLGLRFGKQIGEEGNVYLTRMMNSVRNMETLLEDLLSFSRLSFTNKEAEKVSLLSCLEKAISDLEVKMEETGCVVHKSELPVVEGYPTQLKQLFFNLIGNAIKFRHPGRAPEITISASRVNPYSYPLLPLLRNIHYVKIEISDNGIGFEPEFNEQVFQMFQRLHPKAEYPGSGVGLSICKKITENHHGGIYASSIPGKGSTFTILLPYSQA